MNMQNNEDRLSVIKKLRELVESGDIYYFRSIDIDGRPQGSDELHIKKGKEGVLTEAGIEFITHKNSGTLIIQETNLKDKLGKKEIGEILKDVQVRTENSAQRLLKHTLQFLTREPTSGRGIR